MSRVKRVTAAAIRTLSFLSFNASVMPCWRTGGRAESLILSPRRVAYAQADMAAIRVGSLMLFMSRDS